MAKSKSSTVDLTPEQQLEQRLAKAKLIEMNVKQFKVCEGCTSIVDVRANLCPLCNAYRWDENPKNVIERAYELAKTIRTSLCAADFEEDEDEENSEPE